MQKGVSRLTLRQKRGEMSYEERCRLLIWPTFEKRREYLSIVCLKRFMALIVLYSKFFLNVPNERENCIYLL